MDQPFAAFASWLMRITCDRCGKDRMFAETHFKRRDLALREIINRMRHDGCGGRAAGRVWRPGFRWCHQPAGAADRAGGRVGLAPHFQACGTQLPRTESPPMPAPIDIPTHVGPCEFGQLGNQIAVRCPPELAHILRRAGALWEPGSRRWLVQRRRIWPVIRALERATDPLFRAAGMVLD